MAWDTDALRTEIGALFAPFLDVPERVAANPTPRDLWRPQAARPVGDKREAVRAQVRDARAAEAPSVGAVRAAKASGQTYAQIASWSGLSRATICRYLHAPPARPGMIGPRFRGITQEA